MLPCHDTARDASLLLLHCYSQPSLSRQEGLHIIPYCVQTQEQRRIAEV